MPLPLSLTKFLPYGVNALFEEDWFCVLPWKYCPILFMIISSKMKIKIFATESVCLWNRAIHMWKFNKDYDWKNIRCYLGYLRRGFLVSKLHSIEYSLLAGNHIFWLSKITCRCFAPETLAFVVSKQFSI